MRKELTTPARRASFRHRPIWSQTCFGTSSTTSAATARITASARQVELLDTHLVQLADRAGQLETEQRSHGAALAMWNMGSRPTELIHAINRRANHLAHYTITNREPWVIETIRTWTQHHRAGAHPPDVHRLITEIAAYRERLGHSGDDPLGPALIDPHHHDRRRRLDTRLNHRQERPISSLLRS